MPRRRSKRSSSRSPTFDATCPPISIRSRRRPGVGSARQHGRSRAVSEQARADQHAGIVIQIHRRAADLDADRQHPLGAPAREQRFGRAHVRQGGAASLADEIERKNVGRQAEPLGDVARQAGAQISGARADDDRVDVAGVEAGVGQRALGRLRRDRRRVLREARVEHVGIERETPRSARSNARCRLQMPLLPRSTFRRIACDRGLSVGKIIGRGERPPSTACCVQRVDGAAVPSPLKNIP